MNVPSEGIPGSTEYRLRLKMGEWELVCPGNKGGRSVVEEVRGHPEGLGVKS